MRILHVINSLDFSEGGPPRSLIPIAKTQSKNLKISIISSSKQDFEEEKFEYIKIFLLIKRYYLPNLKGLRILFETIKMNDYIHIHNWWSFLSTFALIFSSILKKKIIITPHGSLHHFNIKKSKFKKYLIYYLVERFFIKNVNGIHYLTNNELENCFFKNKFFFKKIVVPNSIEINEEKLEPQNIKSGYFLYMGRLSKNKNVDFMIDVINMLNKKEKKKFSFIIVGPDYGEKNKLIIKINNLNLHKYVKILEPIYSIDRFSLIKNAKALLLASDYECNSIVVAEALALGVVVISSKECNTEDISKFGACITTIRRDENMFVENIIKILDDSHYDKIKDKAKKYSDEFLNINTNTNKLTELYLKL